VKKLEVDVKQSLQKLTAESRAHQKKSNEEATLRAELEIIEKNKEQAALLKAVRKQQNMLVKNDFEPIQLSST
jgi:hypothetical protein